MSHSTFLPDRSELDGLLARAGLQQAGGAAPQPRAKNPWVRFGAQRRDAARDEDPVLAPAPRVRPSTRPLRSPSTSAGLGPVERHQGRQAGSEPAYSELPDDAPTIPPADHQVATAASWGAAIHQAAMAATTRAAVAAAIPAAPQPAAPAVIAALPDAPPPEVHGSLEQRMGALVAWLCQYTRAKTAFIVDHEGLPLALWGEDEAMLVIAAFLARVREEIAIASGRERDRGVVVQRADDVFRLLWIDTPEGTFCAGWSIPDTFDTDAEERLRGMLHRALHPPE